MSKKGILYLVATPIGNLGDITNRALDILKKVDVIAAEDTRHTLKLLNYFEIKKHLISYHEHNKAEKGNYIINKLLFGEDIALVCDAGTPGISDPGEELVKLAIENRIDVSMAPGPVAAIMGVVLSGFSTGRFVFEGFLPVNKRSKKERIKVLINEERTIILYEAPHKLNTTLKDLLDILGDRKIAIARELTKINEEVLRTTLKEAVEKFQISPLRGEIVLIVEGARQDAVKQIDSQFWSELSIPEHIEFYIQKGIDKKEALKIVAKDRGISKRDVYKTTF